MNFSLPFINLNENAIENREGCLRSKVVDWVVICSVGPPGSQVPDFITSNFSETGGKYNMLMNITSFFK